jgi:hypothetical protein
MQINKNYAQNSDVLFIKGFIDNTEGKKTIDNASIKLFEQLLRVKDPKHSQIITKNSYLLTNIKNRIEIGERYDFSMSVVIPESIRTCTSIGNIVANYFTIDVVSDMVGCCGGQLRLSSHIVLHSRVPFYI